MLQRPTSAPILTPVRWISYRLGSLTGPSSTLLRYVLIAAALTAIGCVYLWQVNDLSTLHDNTMKLQWQAQELEEENVILAEQLAQWNAPSYVERQSAQQGYVAVSPRTIVAPAAPELANLSNVPNTAQ